MRIINKVLLLLFIEYAVLFRHRHVPKSVYKAAKEKRIMLASVRRKYVFGNFIEALFD